MIYINTLITCKDRAWYENIFISNIAKLGIKSIIDHF